ncbi:MAG TPA: DUF1684 domain-containing protein [Thermoanaerobaculia bacterium]|jgi:hypothetical protein
MRASTLLLPLVVAAGVVMAAEPASTGRSEWEQWKDRRLSSLRREDGWLSLVGLFWLQPGENTVGSAKDADVVLPASVPASLGTIVVGDGKGVYKPGAAAASLDGRVVDAPVALVPDTDGEPTTLKFGTVLFYLIRRGDKLAIRAKDSASPVRAKFVGIEMWPYQEAWRKTARFQRYDPPKQIRVPTIQGTVEDSRCPGAVVFEENGKTYSVDAVAEREGDDLWLIFGDATNGEETYGGGRFLYTKPPAADGSVVVDFNRSYNPPCVFTPYATCPLPPKQNKLPIKVEAGEKVWGEH